MNNILNLIHAMIIQALNYCTALGLEDDITKRNSGYFWRILCVSLTLERLVFKVDILMIFLKV